MERRVVVTGLSSIIADSYSMDELWQNLNNKHFFTEQIKASFENNYTYKSRHYVPFPKIDFSATGISAKFGILMEDNAKIAVVCAKAALADAGFEPIKEATTPPPDEIKNAGIIIGTGLNSIKAACSSFVQHMGGHLGYKELSEFRYNRMVIPMTMPNSIAAWISLLCGVKGESFTVNAACASGNYAIGAAFNKLKYGEYEMMICGGVECLSDDYASIMRGFDLLGALTKSADGRPQPFSHNRSGFLFSEGGAGILILEELNHALARKARIYAEILDCGSNSDCHNIVQIEDSGEQIIKLLHKVCNNRKIDYFNAHGTGTFQNDNIEAEILKKVFGNIEEQPLINSTKSIIGHSIGASAAIEAAVTAMSLKKQRVHPNLSESNLTGINIATESTTADLNYAVSASYGFGGHNSAILFKKYSGNDA